MGCSNCSRFDSNEMLIFKDLVKCVQKDDFKKVEKIIFDLARQDKVEEIGKVVNQEIIPFDKGFVNLLAYVFLFGDFKVYTLIVIKLNGSLMAAEEILNRLGYVPINILCKRGALDLLKLYLPVYLSNFTRQEAQKSATLSFGTHTTIPETPLSPSAIQIACAEGHLPLLSFIEGHFSVSCPPPTLDIHYIDEIRGENCALISVRTGNFVMIKYLFEVIHADFHIRNNNNESALQILAAAAKSKCAIRYLECLMYLIEYIKIDITYMYEETLLLLECKISIQYMENKLREVGVMVKKKDIEKQYQNQIKTRKFPQQLTGKNFANDFHELSAIASNSYNSNLSSFYQFNK